MNIYMTKCCGCGQTTSKAHARKHDGHCKACVTSTPKASRSTSADDRNARIIDCGWIAYAREEGHYS